MDKLVINKPKLNKNNNIYRLSFSSFKLEENISSLFLKPWLIFHCLYYFLLGQRITRNNKYFKVLFNA